MSSYEVIIPVIGYVSKIVEANSENEAREMVADIFENFDPGDIHDVGVEDIYHEIHVYPCSN